MSFAGTELNIADLAILLVVLASVLGGIRRGFVGGLLDLIGLVAGVYLAFKSYGRVGELISDSLPLPRGITNLFAFIGLFVVSQGIFSVVIGFVSRGLGRLMRLFPLFRVANALAGVLPGLVKGLVGVTILVLSFGMFPLVPQVKAEIDRSFLGSRTITLASEYAPRLESLLGQTAEDTLIFLSRPQPEKSIRLNLPIPAKLTVDAASEQRMLELVNMERVREGLQPLTLDEKLQSAARGHSLEMFELSYFAHESPVAGSPADRMKAAGAKFTYAAENLAYAPNVEMAHSGLMNSPGHRKNILTPGLRRIGIGVIDGGLKGKMFTQNFAD